VYQQEEVRAQEEVVVASAKLTQLLNLDPTIRLQPLEGPVQLLALVDPAESLESLIQMALENRPEMRARAAAIAASESRYRMEHYRPFLPTISLAYSAGDFGGGSNLVSSTFSNVNGRTDIDLYAVWTLQNLGFGNMARQKGRRAEVNEAIAERTITVNQIRDQVSEAFANVATRQRDLAAARRKLQRAQQGSQRDLIRVRGLEGRPIEVLNNLRLLASARQEFVHALTAYNEAELRLFVSLGQPPIPGTPVMDKDP
jgi:outer membrane protein TolC